MFNFEYLKDTGDQKNGFSETLIPRAMAVIIISAVIFIVILILKFKPF